MATTSGKTDRRVQRSRRLLHQALMELILEKRYDKITVQEIIDRADVGRSTFYAHFLDKDDLLVQGLAMFSAQLETHLQHADVDSNGETRLFNTLTFFRHAGMHHDLYKAMQEGGGADIIMEAGRSHLEQDILNHLDERFPDGLPANIPLPVLTSFLAGAMLSMLMWWLDTERLYTPEEIDAMFQQLAMGGVRGAAGGDKFNG